MPEIEIRFVSDREYKRLRRIRDKYGVQWRGMLVEGAKRLEGIRHPNPSQSLSTRPKDIECTDKPDQHNPTRADDDGDRGWFFESS
jgi:hypothetical protein